MKAVIGFFFMYYSSTLSLLCLNIEQDAVHKLLFIKEDTDDDDETFI